MIAPRWLLGSSIVALLVWWPQPGLGESTTVASLPSAEHKGVAPVCKFTEQVYDFGVMAPQEIRSKTFVLRNAGDADLVIKKVQFSCKCVTGRYPETPIPAGETGEVVITWRGTAVKDRFVQRVFVETNELSENQHELRIVGTVVGKLLMTPDPVNLVGLVRGAPQQAKVKILAGHWDSFEIDQIAPSSESLHATVEPLPDPVATELGFRCGHELTVSIDPALTSDDFHESIDLVATPPNGQPIPLRVLVNGDVRNRLQLYGTGVQPTGLLDLGVVSRSRGLTRNLLLKVNDEEPRLKISYQQLEPSGMTLELKELKIAPEGGLYRMTLKVPPQSVTRPYQGVTAGTLHLEFDHPRIQELSLKVECLPGG